MQIGELAKRTALTADAIRFYEKRRLLPKPIRSTGRFRLYTDDDTERLRFIQQVQGLGFSLAEREGFEPSIELLDPITV